MHSARNIPTLEMLRASDDLIVYEHFCGCCICSTFFKDFHVDLAHTIKGLLSTSDGSQAILFNPRRGDSLDRFVRASQSVELDVEIQERYDSRIWDLHQAFLRNESVTEWPNYDEDHCYPLLLSITHQRYVATEATQEL